MWLRVTRLIIFSSLAPGLEGRIVSSRPGTDFSSVYGQPPPLSNVNIVSTPSRIEAGKENSDKFQEKLPRRSSILF